MHAVQHTGTAGLAGKVAVCGLPLPRRSRISRKSHIRPCRAAATSTGSSDLKALLQDSIQAPAQPVGVPDGGPTTLPAPPAPEMLPAAPTSSFSAVSGATQAAPAGSDGVDASQPLAAGADAISGAVDSARGSLSDAGASAADAVSGALGSASEGLSAVQDTAAAATSSVIDTFSGASQTAASAASAAADSAASSLRDMTSALSKSTGGSLKAVQKTASELLSSANEATGAAQEAVSSTVNSVGSSLQAAVSSAVDSLPEPAQQALAAAGDAAQQVLEAASADPLVAAAATTGLVLVPTLIVGIKRFGGYAGDVAPLVAAEILQTEDAVLVDIRADAVRSRDGVADLERGAIGKGAAVPLQSVRPAVVRSVRKPDEVAVKITAATIAALRQLQDQRTKVIIMDGGDGRAIAVAKALRSFGCERPYVLEGGFRAWGAAGLAVQEGNVDYSVSPLKRIGTSTEMLVEQAAFSLRDPATLIGTAAAVGLTGLALVNWHTALQFIGCSAALFSLANRVTSYSSPQDAVDDLQSGYARVEGTLAGPVRLAKAALEKGTSAAALLSRQQQEPEPAQAEASDT